MMFTEAQIKLALSKSRTGADFPAYIREIKTLGVTYYETHVADGHSIYHGKDHFVLATPPKFEVRFIADRVDEAQLGRDLAEHQRGHSDYPTFVGQCARNGIEKWGICMEAMTCTYFDKAGNRILVESIPG